MRLRIARFRLLIGISAVLLLLVLGPLPRLQAATITVLNTDNDGVGSLRQAILDTNLTVVDDVIDFDAGVSGTITLLTPLPLITVNLEIIGPGEALLSVSGNDVPGLRPFTIGLGATVTISRLTIERGNAGDGGGIFNEGTLTLNQVTVRDNLSVTTGGGIYSFEHPLTLNDSTVIDNKALGTGAASGIFLSSSGSAEPLTLIDSFVARGPFGLGNIVIDVQGLALVTMVRSTVSNGGTGIRLEAGVLTMDGTSEVSGMGEGILHDAGADLVINGGLITDTSVGIQNVDGAMTVNGTTIESAFTIGVANFSLLEMTLNRVTITGSTVGIANHSTMFLNSSTVSGNTTDGVANFGTLTISSSTVSGNTFNGINSSDEVELKNTIVAGNNVAAVAAFDCAGPAANFNSLGHNLDGDGTCNLVGLNDQTNPNPMLGPLQNNGGPTETHALLAGSPAINAGICLDPDGNPVTTDQRGVARPQGGACDIGAYEFEPGGGANTPPVVEDIDPADPINIDDQPIEVSADFTDADDLSGEDNYTCTADHGDVMAPGAVDGTVTGMTCTGPGHIYPAAGVYEVTVEVTDEDGGTGSATGFIVIYDPAEGFVTGGGWIDSPVGADGANPLATGKATFGFVSKYKKGATTPTGKTEFQFKAGDLNFHSDTYEWLVVGGPLAQFKGTGTINGEGTYDFLIRATDGALSGGGPDQFRMQIFGRYDNGADQDLGAGSIVIHTK